MNQKTTMLDILQVPNVMRTADGCLGFVQFWCITLLNYLRSVSTLLKALFAQFWLVVYYTQNP